MKRAFILPGGTAVEQLELAVLAEESGWDGFFVWEAAFGIDAGPEPRLPAMCRR